MFNALTNFLTKISRRYLPDAYVFALLLTIFVFLAGIIFQDKSPLEMINYWGNGFWNLTSFSMQMVLVLVTGFTLAKTNFISQCIRSIAKLASSNSSAVLVVTLTSVVACYLNWGFGLIVSALLAVEVAKNVRKVNFGLLLASAYSGFLVWHGGLSGSIPLKLTEPSQDIKNIIGVERIDLHLTIFSMQNLIILFATVITLIIVNFIMSFNHAEIKEFDYDEEHSVMVNKENNHFADQIENSKMLTAFVSLGGVIYLVHYFIQGMKLNLNIMIFIFLILSIMLSKTANIFLSHFQNSVKDSAGIILQFPFYAGMMSMMTSSGLAERLSTFFVQISSENTFLFFTYISAGIVNFFVPSGGGQWAVQGPIILPAAQALGIDFAKASMAIAWGDAWSNMLQPFWALPLLSIGKISLGQLMGYCVIVFIAVGIVTSSVYLLFP